jgi:hypothetical protein
VSRAPLRATPAQQSSARMALSSVQQPSGWAQLRRSQPCHCRRAKQQVRVSLIQRGLAWNVLIPYRRRVCGSTHPTKRLPFSHQTLPFTFAHPNRHLRFTQSAFRTFSRTLLRTFHMMVTRRTCRCRLTPADTALLSAVRGSALLHSSVEQWGHGPLGVVGERRWNHVLSRME